jgi:hypothetical protein
MKLRLDNICTLATSPTWQVWLYNNATDLYRQFMTKMANSKGCSQNRKIMLDTVDTILSRPERQLLIDFISTHYPYMIEGRKPIRYNNDAVVFEYDPKVLTYPRRIIFTGNLIDIKRKVNSFVLDKYKYDSIVVGNKAYVEYLTSEDKDLEGKIPIQNWKIPAYRMKHSNA